MTKKPTPLRKLKMSAMTKGGAATLFSFYKKHFGAVLIGEIAQISEGKWGFTMAVDGLPSDQAFHHLQK